MNWKDYIQQLALFDESTIFETSSPASSLVLQTIQNQFQLGALPEELKELYDQTNGVVEKLGDTIIGELLWPAERVLETNREFRESVSFKDLYMSFDQLLFFSDAGNGDLFGFVTLNGRFDRNDIFVWNHEDDSRTWVAPNLTQFLEWWTNSTIKV